MKWQRRTLFFSYEPSQYADWFVSLPDVKAEHGGKIGYCMNPAVGSKSLKQRSN